MYYISWSISINLLCLHISVWNMLMFPCFEYCDNFLLSITLNSAVLLFYSGLTQSNYKELNILYEKYKDQGSRAIFVSFIGQYINMLSHVFSKCHYVVSSFQVLKYSHFLAISLLLKSQELMKKFRKLYVLGLKLNSQYLTR